DSLHGPAPGRAHVRAPRRVRHRVERGGTVGGRPWRHQPRRQTLCRLRGVRGRRGEAPELLPVQRRRTGRRLRDAPARPSGGDPHPAGGDHQLMAHTTTPPAATSADPRWQPVRWGSRLGTPVIGLDAHPMHRDGPAAWGAYLAYIAEHGHDALPPLSDDAVDFAL